MSLLSVYVIICFLSCIIPIFGWIETFVRGHEVCRMEIDRGAIQTGIKYYNNSITAPAVELHCEDAEYYRATKERLQANNGTDIKSQILRRIVSLYDDLAISKEPGMVRMKGFEILVHPVAIPIPKQFLVELTPPKSKDFGRVIPGDYRTYFSSETQYRDDMSQSLFTFTYHKAGWDCLRHSEILAAGSLPLFHDIEKCPRYALSLHPKQLYSLINQFPGVTVNGVRDGHMVKYSNTSVDHTKFDEELYLLTQTALLQYTENVLTTSAMANHILDVVSRYRNNGRVLPFHNVLYITHQNEELNSGDYVTDLILHGFHEVLGQSRLTEFPYKPCLHKTLDDFNATAFEKRRQTLYGMGFTFGLSIAELWLPPNRSTYFFNDTRNADHPVYLDIKENIINHKYDLIVFGSGHRRGHLPFWDEVCRNYGREEVAWIEGDDAVPEGIFHRQVRNWIYCVGHYFSREGLAPKAW